MVIIADVHRHMLPWQLSSRMEEADTLFRYIPDIRWSSWEVFSFANPFIRPITTKQSAFLLAKLMCDLILAIAFSLMTLSVLLKLSLSKEYPSPVATEEILIWFFKLKT